MKKKWFEGSRIVDCNIEDIKLSIEDMGEFHKIVTSFMPGIKNVELLEQGSDYVNIRTNEGLMKRTEIKKIVEPNRVVFEFNEEYHAGRMITTNSHHSNEFSVSEKGVQQRLIISEVDAHGILGFFYRIFGSKSIGNGILDSFNHYIDSTKDTNAISES